MKTLLCRDIGFDCDAKVEANTNEEVLAQAADHASRVHGVTVTPEMAEKVIAQIHDSPN